MSRVRLCTGNYATTPYEIRQTGLRIFSIEELCYYFCSHVEILDADFFEADLFEWIEKELSLSALAAELKRDAQNGAPMDLFVRRILLTCNYCTSKQIEQMVLLMRENAKLNHFERKKKQIDHLAAEGKYELAIREYQRLLAKVEGKELALSAAICMAIGSLLARMFYFSGAEEYFDRAYYITYRKECLVKYLCAVRMHGTKAEQDAKIMGRPELMELIPEVDELMHQHEVQYQASTYCEDVKKFREHHENGKDAEYYELVDTITKSVKEDFRKQCEC